MSSILLTTDDLRRWREEIAGIDEEAARLLARREHLQRLLDAASVLAAGSNMQDSEPATEIVAFAEQSRPAHAERPKELPAIEAEVPIDLEEGMSWNTAVRRAVYAYPSGVVSHVLKQQIRRSPLGSRLDASDKGYYNAIGRLARRGEILKHNGRLFSREAFDTYMQAVGRGEIDDTAPPPAATYSPMGARIEEIIAARPGVGSLDVIRELQGNPEFAAALDPRPTVAYNIIARLRNRGRIRKVGARLYPPSKRDEPFPHRTNGSFAGEGADGRSSPPSLWDNP